MIDPYDAQLEEGARTAFEDLITNEWAYSYLGGNPFLIDDDTIIREAESRLYIPGLQWQCSCRCFLGYSEVSCNRYNYKEACFGEMGKSVEQALLFISIKDLLLNFRYKYPSLF